MFDWLFGKAKITYLSVDEQSRLSSAHIHVVGHALQHWQGEASMLTALDSGELAVRSSCRNGNCGACIAYLIKGEVGYVKTVHFPLEKNELLMCSCVPIGDIEIALPLHPIEPRKRKRYSY